MSKNIILTINSILISLFFLGCSNQLQNVNMPNFSSESEVKIMLDNDKNIFLGSDLDNFTLKDRFAINLKLAALEFKKENITRFLISPNFMNEDKDSYNGITPFINKFNDLVNFCEPKEEKLEKKCEYLSEDKIKIAFIPSSENSILPSWSVEDILNDNEIASVFNKSKIKIVYTTNKEEILDY